MEDELFDPALMPEPARKKYREAPICHGGVRVALRSICVSLVPAASSSTTTKLLMNAILARIESINRTGTVWLMV